MIFNYTVEPFYDDGGGCESPSRGYAYKFWEREGKDSLKVVYRDHFGWPATYNDEERQSLPTGRAKTLTKAIKKMQRHMKRYKRKQLKLEKRFNTREVHGGYYEF